MLTGPAIVVVAIGGLHALAMLPIVLMAGGGRQTGELYCRSYYLDTPHRLRYNSCNVNCGWAEDLVGNMDGYRALDVF